VKEESQFLDVRAGILPFPISNVKLLKYSTANQFNSLT